MSASSIARRALRIATTVRATSMLAASSIAACAPADTDDLARASAPILGGADDAGDPAVLLIASYPADLTTLDTCSAVLLAPDVVLTAAHCLDAAAHPGEKHGVFVGPDASAYPTASTLVPRLVPITEVHLHPDYQRAAPFRADIAIAKLASPLSIAPLPILRRALTPDDVGRPARIVGYGETKYQQPNLVKHTADTALTALDPDDTITVGDVMHKSCIGDSGGPAFMMLDGRETVVGIDSYTDLQGCLEPAHYRRTDAYTAFIDGFVPPPPDPTAASTASSGGASASSSSAGGAGGGALDDGGGCAIAAPERGDASIAVGLAGLAVLAWGRRRARTA